MAGLLTERRVRREDLNGSDGSEWSDGGDNDELRERLNARIARSLGLDNASPEPRAPAAEPSRPKASGERAPLPEPAEDPEDDVYEFRLFSTSTQTAKVVLEDDQVLKGNGTFVASRPQSYYLVDVPDSERERYEVAAVTAEDVLAQSQWKAPGLELPWKVTETTATKKKETSSKDSGIGSDKDTAKRKRPGKKRRIALRTKERAKKAKDEATAKQQTDKEEHLKDKKKRLNRLKKLRKRAKEKEKKLAAKGEGEGGGGSDGSESEDSDGSE